MPRPYTNTLLGLNICKHLKNLDLMRPLGVQFNYLQTYTLYLLISVRLYKSATMRGKVLTWISTRTIHSKGNAWRCEQHRRGADSGAAPRLVPRAHGTMTPSQTYIAGNIIKSLYNTQASLYSSILSKPFPLHIYYLCNTLAYLIYSLF